MTYPGTCARFARKARAATVCCILTALMASCGFGRYDDAATPQQTGANNGVWGDGQWWPWACPNGSSPSPATAPLPYTVTGSCGAGGDLALSVDGCEMVADWTVLGLADVTTNVSSSIPGAGGWEVAGTGSGNGAWTCDATVDASRVLTFTCTAGDPAAPVCISTLSPVNAL